MALVTALKEGLQSQFSSLLPFLVFPYGAILRVFVLADHFLQSFQSQNTFSRSFYGGFFEVFNPVSA